MYVITDYFQTFSELAPILYFPIMLIHVFCIAPKETAIKNPLTYELCPIRESSSVRCSSISLETSLAFC